MVLPRKNCSECGRSIRRRADSYPYVYGVCTHCINDNPKYRDLKRQIKAQSQRQLYNSESSEYRAKQLANSAKQYQAKKQNL